MESEKYLASNAANDGGKVSSRFEIGNNLALNINLPASTGGGAVCGNNIKETGETCDGTDLGGATCASVLGSSYIGNLSCNTGCTSFNTNACTYQIPTNGLIGYWKFDETSGTTATDSSGNNNSGIFSGSGVTWTIGKVGGAVNFAQNTYDRINFPAAFTYSDFTISFWAKPYTHVGGEQYPVDIGPGTSAYKPVVAIFLDSTLNFVNWHLYGSSALQPTTGQINDIWQYVVFTRSGGNASVYVNGQLLSSVSNFTMTNPVNDYLTVGSIHGWTGDYSYRGSIDELAIYNRALTAGEILAIYNGQK
jgi:hypothetical protein